MTARAADTRRITVPEEALTDLANAMVLLRSMRATDPRLCGVGRTTLDIAVDAMLAILDLADIEQEGAAA